MSALVRPGRSIKALRTSIIGEGSIGGVFTFLALGLGHRLELEHFVGANVVAARGVEDSIGSVFTLVSLDAVLVVGVAPESFLLEFLGLHAS